MPTTNRDTLLKLYKYRSLAGEPGRRAAVDIVRDNRMWWQSPLSFNDPFDCSPALVFGHSVAARKAFVRRITSKHMAASRAVRLRREKELLRTPRQEHEEHQREGFMRSMEQSAVSCFSDVGDSLLMWAHYANSHQGICFVFQEQLSPPWFAFQVKYSEERPLIDLTNLAGKQLIEDAILNKSIDWQYEHEHRMFDYRVPPGYRYFPPETLVGVIYGARISIDDRAFVDDLITKRGKVERYQASIDRQYFRVNITPSAQ